MKKVSLFILAILVMLAFAGCSSSKPDKIAYINMEDVLANSQWAKQLEQELVDIGNDLEVKYNEKQNELSADENEEENKELDQISQEYLENKQRLEGLLNQEITEIIDRIAEEENISTVLYSGTVYYGGSDITEEVINILDERYIEAGESTDGQ